MPRGLRLLIGAGLFLPLLACGDIGGSGQCGGVDVSRACLKIESIAPTYEPSGGPTSDVDAYQDTCDPGPPVVFETITDHDATVTFSNKPVGDAPSNAIPDVTITQYTITYTLNSCPAGMTCPAITPGPVTVFQTFLIPANSTVSVDLKFVDLQMKIDYSNNAVPFPPPFLYPSYTATYTFSGTDHFQHGVSATGFTEFTIGDYDNC